MNTTIILFAHRLESSTPFDTDVECYSILLPSLNTCWLQKEWNTLAFNPHGQMQIFTINSQYNNINATLLWEALNILCARVESLGKTPNDIGRITINKSNKDRNGYRFLTTKLMMKDLLEMIEPPCK